MDCLKKKGQSDDLCGQHRQGAKSEKCAKNDIDCRLYFGSDHLKKIRAKTFQCKSKRIRILAQPKYLTQRIVFEKQPDGNKTQIVKNFDELPTRIKMLAIPKVRKLIASRNEYKNLIESHRIENYDNLIQKSITTIYSKLANVSKLKKCKRQKWTREDWMRHCQWLRKRACPKVYREPAPRKRKNVPLRQLQVSIYTLSQPRYPREKYRRSYGYISTVKDSVKYYTPSDRIIRLAVPKQLDVGDVELEEFDPYKVNPSALKFTPSERIKELAVSKSQTKINPVEEESDLTDFGISKRALNAEATTRTVELSKPKPQDDDDEEKEKPLVSKKALKAKPTKRILELAKPREYQK